MCARDESATQKSPPPLQSAFELQVLSSKAQYWPSGSLVPVRVMRDSKQGLSSKTQVPAEAASQGPAPAQLRKGSREQCPSVSCSQSSVSAVPQMKESSEHSFGFC